MININKKPYYDNVSHCGCQEDCQCEGYCSDCWMDELCECKKKRKINRLINKKPYRDKNGNFRCGCQNDCQCDGSDTDCELNSDCECGIKLKEKKRKIKEKIKKKNKKDNTIKKHNITDLLNIKEENNIGANDKIKNQNCELYVVHEHSQYTSAFDKYWKFSTYDKAYNFFKDIVMGYIKSDEEFDMDEYIKNNYLDIQGSNKQLFEDLGDGNYIRLQILFDGDEM